MNFLMLDAMRRTAQVSGHDRQAMPCHDAPHFRVAPMDKPEGLAVAPVAKGG